MGDIYKYKPLKAMKKLVLIFTFLLLFAISCITINNQPRYNGAVIKYKFVDTTGQWLELGLKDKNRKFLMYLPMEYDSVLSLNDTLHVIILDKHFKQ